MAIVWNDDQRQVIGHRDGSLLVSAAAGSGKTAVMIERLVRMITDPEDPVDVEELLVVTFTNAAAAQMRDKLSDRLLETYNAETDPERRRKLMLQIRRLPLAAVMTIHSFCLQCIREFITRIEELDPGFRIADETEAALLKADVLEEVLEDAYAWCSAHPEAEESRRFLAFADGYSGARQDRQIEDRIREAFAFLESLADPAGWLEKAVHAYDIADDADLTRTAWYQVEREAVRRQAETAAALYRQLREEYWMADCEPDHKIVLQIEVILQELQTTVQEGSLPDPSRIRIARMDYKPWKEDPARKEKVQGLAEQARKAADAIAQIPVEWQAPDSAAMLREKTYPAMQGLAWILDRYTQAYAAAKQEREIVDFADLEHFALRILLHNGQPTAEAQEIRDRFRYICVDEYQDSNDVQEAILHAIARCNAEGTPVNLFMVGDVKQSIYKFREARPELFLKKLREYPETEDASVRYLHSNFRSRAEILSAVNDIFAGLMYLPDGEIEYTEKEALVSGLPQPPDADGMRVLGGKPELCILQSDTPLRAAEAEENEALYVAQRIQNLVMSGACIYDKNTGYRPIRYRDIAVLMRTNKTQAPLLTEAFRRFDVPSYSEITTGFYQTKEVQCVLNMLRIIDNPLQDIPLAGVLYSPAFAFSGKDLARIRRAGDRDLLLFEALEAYAEQGEDPALLWRVRQFLVQLQTWRQERLYLPLHELIWKLLQDTGYYVYISGTPEGTARRANLDLLMERAIAYEKGSFSGLFHFLRYVEKMEDRARDEIQASLLSDEEDVVRILSIHKSKGLEYPVVFVCGTGHQMNRMDLSGRILLHPELGIGAQAVDPEKGFYYETMPHRAIQEKKKWESLAEEMRVLYVGLTRAQQKLYVTGYMKKDPDAVELVNGRLPGYIIRSASCYLDWLRPLAEASPNWDVLTWKLEVEEPEPEQPDEVPEAETLLPADHFSAAWDRTLLWGYPEAWREQLPSRFSVSQLKKPQDPITADQVVHTSFPEEDDNAGTRAGSAIHKVLSLLDLTDLADPAEQIRRLQAEGVLSAEEAAMVPEEQIRLFAASRLAGRMQRTPRLLREQPFIVEIPIARIRAWVPGWMPDLPESADAESVMVQGIIDCCFIENGRWVVVDYKSDRVFDRSRVEAYEKQLNLYAYALETITELPVAELMMYQTRTGREVIMERKDKYESNGSC